jgi:hypothetical protein
METLSRIVRPSISIPYPVYPAYLSSPAWSPVGHNASSAPSSSPVAPQPRSNPGRVPLSLVPTPFSGNPFDPNSHFRSPSSESAGSLFDELVTPLEDLRLSESFTHRPSYPLTPPSSAPGIYLPIASPTSAYPGLPGHYVDRFGVPSPRPGGLSHHTRRSSSQSSRKLAASYKSMWLLNGAATVHILTIIQPNRVNFGGRTAAVQMVKRVRCKLLTTCLDCQGVIPKHPQHS